MANSLNFSIS